MYKDGMICDEQGGFRPDRKCVDQVFALREPDHKAHIGFMDLKKRITGRIRKLI